MLKNLHQSNFGMHLTPREPRNPNIYNSVNAFPKIILETQHLLDFWFNAEAL